MENTTGVKHIDTTTGFTPMQFASASNYALSLIAVGKSCRTRLASDVYQALGKPERVDIAAKEKLILVTSHPDGSGMYQVKKADCFTTHNCLQRSGNLQELKKTFKDLPIAELYCRQKYPKIMPLKLSFSYDAETSNFRRKRDSL